LLSAPIAHRHSPASGDRAVILLLLVGGPSGQETFDPKPKAPTDCRGPFGAIASRLPGVAVSELLPRLAQRLHRVCLVRTLFHESAPIHETGLQLIQGGRLIGTDVEESVQGSVLGLTNDARRPWFALLPGRLGSTGVAVSRGQERGALGVSDLPRAAVGAGRSGSDTANPHAQIDASLLDLESEPRTLLDAYGPTPFGRNCLRARRLVEAGSRLVVVNMFPTVFDGASWDCHGKAPFAGFADYRESVCPSFDLAFSALVDDLTSRGWLDRTLIVATGEFGRAPAINGSGGRDHWPRAWSALLAGGHAPAGHVLGATDRWGGEPTESPVDVRSLHATMLSHLGRPNRFTPLFG
jgi:hypothetical protein